MEQEAPSWKRLGSTVARDVGVRCLWVVGASLLLTMASAGIMQVELLDAEATFTSSFYTRVSSMHGVAAIFGVLVWIVPTLGSLLIPNALGAREVGSAHLNAVASWGWVAVLAVAIAVSQAEPEPGGLWAAAVALALMLLVTLAILNLALTTWRRRAAERPLPLFGVSLLWLGLLCLHAWLGSVALALVETGSWLEKVVAVGHVPLKSLTPALALAPAVGLASDVLEKKGGPLRRRWLVQVVIAGLVVREIIPTYWAVELTTFVLVLPVVGIWIAAVRSQGRGDPAASWVLGLIPTLLLAMSTDVLRRSLSVDVHLHDTTFVVGSFHYIASCSLIAMIAALLAHWRRITGREPARRLGHLGAFTTVAGLHVAFFCQLVAGQQGMPRRYHVYHAQFEPYLQLATVGTAAFCLGLLVTAAALARPGPTR
jgi:heme/copper-type cytochrome/quinol oxidase subunit 1